jgi:hypothetical protein
LTTLQGAIKMAQEDYVIADQTGVAFRGDLNNTLAAIVSNNSGATEPATMYAYMWWADTNSGILKQRNSSNNAWVNVMTLAGIKASDIRNTAAGDIAATNVQTALNELDTDKYAKTGGALTGQATSTAGDFNLVVNTALSDAAATLTAAQLIGGEFTITPTVARIQTLDTAANIISALSGSQDGSNFTFTVVNLAAFDVTIATAAGVTLVGNMVVNNGNALFRVRRLSASTVSVTRLEAISIFTKEYESAQQTITNAGLLTLTHGLSVKPKLLDFYLVCTAADVGYSIGDQIQANLNSTTSSTNRYNTYYVTTTQIFLRFADNVQPFITGNKSSGAAVGADTLKWNLVVRAYA